MIRGLEKLREGVYLNPADRHYLEKRTRYGRDDAVSPLTEARLYVEAGRTRQARELYLKLLRVKDNYEIHTKLAPLLTSQESAAMARAYRRLADRKQYGQETSCELGRMYRDIAMLYEANTSIDMRRIGANGAQIQRSIFSYWGPLALLALLVALLAMIGMAVWTFYRSRIVDTTIVTHVQNQVAYVDALPDFPNQSDMQVQVPNPRDVQAVVRAVDLTVTVPAAEYLIRSGPTLVGEAQMTALGHYDIRLLNAIQYPTGLSAQETGLQRTPNGMSQVPATGLQRTPSGLSQVPNTRLSDYRLNAIRTAFLYYLSTHNQVPPVHLAALSQYLPAAVDLTAVSYNYPLTDPVSTIRPRSNALVPFHSPTLYVRLRSHTLELRYGKQELLNARIGEGTLNQPTPTGTFTISQRIVTKTPTGLYGPYVFPLNNSPFAIHGTNATRRVGGNQSLGCIEVNNAVDRRLYQLVPVGTPVVISVDDSNAVPVPTSFR